MCVSLPPSTYTHTHTHSPVYGPFTYTHTHSYRSPHFTQTQGTLTFNHRQIGNPAGRYGTVSFPKYSQPLGLCQATTFNQTSPIPFSFCNIAFTLGPRDAIVWLGCTPPPVAYFSIRSYVAFRFEPQVCIVCVCVCVNVCLFVCLCR